MTDARDGFASRYGRWAVIAGGSEGIGSALADQLAARGLDLVLIARNEALLEEVATGARDRHGVQTRVVVQDLTAGDLAHGLYVRPTVFTGVDPASELATEEVFGPVLAVLRVHSLDEALQVADATRFGLSAGIVTSDIGRAMTFARRVGAGLVKINQPTTGQAMNAPFGGVKDSSTQTSKEQAGDAMMAFYTVDKTVYLSA